MHRLPVDARARHRFIGIHDGDVFGKGIDRVGLKIVRVTAAVVALVVLERGERDMDIDREPGDHVIAHLGMLAQEIALVIVEFSRLPQDLVRDPELPDVIDEAGLDQDVEIGVGELQPFAEDTGDQRRVEAVPVGHVILGRRHIVEIVQEQFRRGGIGHDILVHLHQILHPEGLLIQDIIHEQGLIDREILVILLFEPLKFVGHTDPLIMGRGEIDPFLDDHRHDLVAVETFDIYGSESFVCVDDHIAVVVDGIFARDHAGL